MVFLVNDNIPECTAMKTRDGKKNVQMYFIQQHRLSGILSLTKNTIK